MILIWLSRNRIQPLWTKGKLSIDELRNMEKMKCFFSLNFQWHLSAIPNVVHVVHMFWCNDHNCSGTRCLTDCRQCWSEYHRSEIGGAVYSKVYARTMLCCQEEIASENFPLGHNYGDRRRELCQRVGLLSGSSFRSISDRHTWQKSLNCVL